jgi:hypothetical protein
MASCPLAKKSPSNVPQSTPDREFDSAMALTDLFIRKLKHSGKSSGDKYSDGRSLYLLVKANKYWRMNYRYEGKHKTLPLGTYPDVSLAEAREKSAEARKLLRAGTDPNPKKGAHHQDESGPEYLRGAGTPVAGEDGCQPQRRDPGEGAGLATA